MKHELKPFIRFTLLASITTIVGLGQVSVLTQHNDNARTGQNLSETILNTSNVNQNTFGKLFSRTVDGFIYAQPLYVPGLTIAGAAHNVVFVATQHNSVYAFDADNPEAATPLWQVNLGTPVPSQDICILTGDTNPSDCPYYDISPEIGITSTPAIDPVGGYIYVVNRTKNTSNSTYHDYIHALSLTTGADELGGPVEITGQVNGTSMGSVGGVLTFNPAYQHQRPSLLLLNGYIYIGFGSVGDIGTWHGWVMTYNASTLQQVAIFGVSPDGDDGGVWSSGQGPVADAAGNVYIMTANGDFNANTAGGIDYGDSFVKFSGPSLAVTDYFTPTNQGTLNADNTDLGSGGTMLMPGTSLLVGIGKDGIFRVVNTNDMGGYNSSVDNDVQEFAALSHPLFSSPIYWNSPNNGPVVYIWGPADYLKAFAYTGSTFNTTPVTQSTIQNSSAFANAASLSVSADGSLTGTGIVWSSASISLWASGVQVPGVVRAFDATNLNTELWDSTQNLTRDDVGNYAKMVPPTIANGKVYMASDSGHLQVYGLNPPQFQGIQFVQVASATPQSSTATVPVAYPGAQTSGDLNVVIVGWNDTAATVQSVTDSLGNTYRLAVGPTTGTGLTQSIYYSSDIVGGSNNTVTVTFNQAATKPDIRVLEYSGVATSSPLDISVGASGNGYVADSGFATTTAANELIVGGNIATSNATIMAGAPFTPRVITTTDSDVAEDRLVNVAGSYHAWAPLNSTSNWVMQMATFRAVVSGTAPIVSLVSPASGLPAGGTAVTITGTNFGSGATVTFGSTAATNVVVVNSGTITATTPAGTVGAVTVTVTNPGGQSGSLANGFTYSTQPGPSVTSLSPNNGPTAGGTAVTITGTNFATGATVTFGGTAATNVVVVSSTSITATTPVGSVGAVTVMVTVNSLSGSLVNGFTYTGTVAIAFSQVASATPQTATASVPVTYPAAQTAGDLNVVVVGWNDNTSTVQSVKDSAGNTYTLAVGPTVGTGLEQSIYYAANIVGGSNTVTVTFSQAAAYPDIRILEYRGVTALDVTAGASGSSTAANSGAATTTVANELIFGANTVSTGNGTVGSGFTSRIITTPDGDLAEDKIVTAAGSNSATATLSGSGPWVMQMATFSAVSGPVPTVSSVSPTSGSTAGGTVLTITGTNFVTGATVTIGGAAATNVVVASGTSITADTPAGTAGAVTVTVTNPGGQSGSLASAYTYIAPPTVTSVSPNSGTTVGGTAVTITGTNFASGATVKFGGTAATNVVVVSATSITATTPAGSAGAAAVTVTNSNKLSGSLASGFTYVAQPTVSSVSPNSGSTAGGTAVTITGTNFVSGATVTFGSTAATNVVVVSSTSITATTPAGTAGAVAVAVTVSGLSGSLANGYTYVVTPTVSSVSPNSGTTAGGTAVTITGTNFAAGATVTFGTAAATNVVVVSATSITATTPAGSAGAVTVTVMANGLSGSLTGGFTYVAPPTVSSVSPNSGSTAGGTAVTITGTNFVAGATVKFGSTAATNVVVVSSTSITATTPASTAGAVAVTVTVSGLSGSLASGFTYVVTPTVTSVSPANGPVAGGTAVTITGTNFASGATVKFGSTAATNVVVVSATSITATTPAASVGVVTVTVTNTSGLSGSLASGFTYVASPTVSSVSPNSGSTAGGTAVTITGTNFASGATVTFGGAAGTNVVVVSSTSITASTPAGSAGAVTVTVTNVGSLSGSLASGYTYVVPPTVTSVSPNSGSVAGGTAVTITGTNFATGATVKFGSTAATNVVVVSSTSITATTPAGSAGAVTLTVTNTSGLSGSLVNGFTYTGTVAIAFSQVASATPQTATASVPVTYPAAQTAGDLNVVVVGWNDNTSTVQSVKDSAGNTYTLAVGPTVGTGLEQSIYYAANIVGGSNTVTVTFSQAAAYPDIRILEYRGVTALDVTAGASGSSTAANSGAATTTVANELIFGANTVSTGNGTVGSGFTSRIITTPDGDLAEDKIVTAAGSNSATATLSGSGPWVMQMATFSAVSGPVPTVSSVSPTSGSTAGGTVLTITGTNFVTGATVTIGGAAATNVVVASGTSITADTPAGTAGAVTVTVTNPGGQSGSLASAYTYIAPPTVTSVSPNSGTTVGGTAVTITGTNFASGATVKFGGTAATNVTVVSATSITATTPAGSAGAATVTVTNTSGLSGSLASGFTYVAQPTVSSVSPNSGSTAGGTAVTITGTNFVSGATVTFGSTAATNVVVVSSTSITATTPAGTAGAVAVAVTVSGLSGSLANGYTYVVTPTVSSVSPNSGTTAGGTAVTITGTNFAAGATVTFGTAAGTNVVVVSATSITATTPAGSAGAVTVTVTANGLSGSLTGGFTYVAPPTVSSVSPNSGSTAGGTAVTITGTNFVAGATVKFGSTAATNVVVVSSTSITATTPASTAGAVAVTVTVSGLSGSLASGFTYVVTPTVTSVSPANGPVAGGTAVTITGTNFASGATVKFGSTAATNVVVVSATSITATTPAASVGVVTVTVTNTSGLSGSLASGFTYVASPTVSSVSPNSGSTAGGTAVTITGTNFASGATVTFGGAAGTNVVVVSSTSITASTPAGSAGAVTVTVTNVGSLSGSLASGYTYVVPPTVTSVSPNSGSVAGGTAVTITGTNFATGATVKFGSTAATNVVVVSSTSITATTPAGSAGAVTLTVTNTSGLSGSLVNGFTYTGTVAIAFSQVASATPQTATASVPVTYPAAQTAGDLNVVVVGWNDNTSTVQSVKDSAGNTYTLAVGPTVGTGLEQSIYYAANIVGGSNTVTVTFSQAAAYPDIRILEYRGVTALDVTAGASGSSTAANSGAATTTVANELIFGANTVSTGNGTVGSGFTSRIITTPDGDLAEDKIVTAAGSNSATATLSGSGPWVMQMATFSAVSGPVPTVSSVSPTSGSTAGGTVLTITGTNFVTGATVTIGGAAATNVVVASGTSITADTPAGTAGAVTVTVTNPGGQSGSLASAYTYIAPPTVTSVSPNSGTTVGGTAVTITGTNFASGATVKFGGTAATNVTVVSATSITATTPAGSAGAATVTVTNTSGLSGSLASGFTYVAQPTVSSVSPNSGSTAGGTAVTITGTNFVSGATVTFGSTAATNVVVVSSTSITATTPAGTAGAVAVAVTVSSLSGSLANGYTYVVTGAPTAPGNFVSALAGTSVPTYVAGQEYYNATPGTSFTSSTFNSTGADLLVMFLGCHNHTIFTIADSFGNTWLPLAGPAYKVGSGSFPMEGEFFYAANAKTGIAHTVTVTLSQSEPLVMSISAISGDNVYSPIDAYTSINGDNGTLAKYVTSNPLTTFQPNDLLLGIVKGFGNNTYTATGYTTQSASTGLNFSAETGAASSVGNYNASFTASVSDFWQSVIAAIAPKPTQTVMSWTASTGGAISNYLIERCAGVGCSNFSQIASVSGSTLTFTDISIVAGTIYGYRVRAESSGVFGPYSTVQAVSPIIPLVVSTFSASTTGTLTWNVSGESGGSISQYSIERCTGMACSNFSQIATTGSTSYMDTSAATGTTYNYRVRAQDANGFYGPYSTVATATIPAYFDNAVDGGNNGGATTSLTYSYTVGTNSNRLLLVNLIGDTSADDITSVKYAGASMTLVTKVQTPGDRWHYLYYLLSPASGTNNVMVTAVTAHYLISEAASWYNVTQSPPASFTTNTAASGVSMTTSLPASSNDVIVAESIWAYTGVLPDAGSAPLVVDATFDGLGIFSSVPSVVTQAFPMSMTNTWGGQDSASSIMASFSLASNGTPGIGYDNSIDGGNNGGTTTSLTYSYTVGTGSNRLLLVNLIGDTMADDISSVTYNGAALTLIGKVQAPSNNWQYLYYLVNPASGAHNIVVTAGSAHYLISEAASWYNVNQSGQVDASTINTAPAGATSFSTSLTTVSNGALVAQGLWSYGHLNEGTGASRILVDAAIGGAGIFVSNGSPVSPAGKVNMTTISDGTQSSSVIMASFAPAP